MEDNKWSPLMEKNWKRMNLILDQELPLKKKKRRNLVPLFLFIVAGLGLLILYQLSFYVSKSTPGTDLPKPLFVLNQALEEKTGQNSDTLCFVEQTKHKLTLTNQHIFSGEEPKLKKATYDNGVKIIEVSTMLSQQKHSVYVDQEFKNTKILDNTIEDLPINSVIDPGVVIINKLSEKEDYLLESSQEKNVLILNQPSVKNENRKTWHFGFQSSMLYNRLDFPQQLYFGFFTGKSLNHSLVLEGHLGIKNHNRYSGFLRENGIISANSNDLMEASVASSVNIYNLDSKSLTSSTISYLNESIIRSTFSSAQYIEGGLAMGYMIQPRIIFKGGFSIGRFVNGEYDLDDSSKNIYTSFTNAANFDNFDLTQADNLLKKWYTTGFLGIDIKCNEIWSLTSSITVGGSGNSLDYSQTAIIELADITRQSSEIFKKPEKGTVSFSIGAKYYLK